MRTLGVSGFGSIGRRHARVAAASGWRVTVFDPFPPGPAERAGLPDGISFAPDFDALLDAGVDAVVVATPDEAHPGQAIACCARGVPVLVEKPLAASTEAARRVEEAARRTGTPVLCGYVLRHSAALRAARDVLQAGDLGDVASFHVDLGAYDTLEVARSRFGPDTRDTLYVDYSHEWDYLRWLFGPVSRVCGHARTVRELPLVQAPNVLDALVELEGAAGSVHLDYVQRPGCRVLTVVGTLGTLAVDMDAARLTIRDVRGGEQTRSLGQERDDLFRRQLANLAGVANGTATAAATAADGVRALEVAEALIESVRTGGWVPVRSR
jgi:predicted dehydrogenase